MLVADCKYQTTTPLFLKQHMNKLEFNKDEFIKEICITRLLEIFHKEKIQELSLKSSKELEEMVEDYNKKIHFQKNLMFLVWIKENEKD